MSQENNLTGKEKFNFLLSHIDDERKKYETWWRTLTSGAWVLFLSVPLTILLKENITGEALNIIQILLVIYIPIFLFLIGLVFSRIHAVYHIKKCFLKLAEPFHEEKLSMEIDWWIDIISTMFPTSDKRLYEYFLNSKGNFSFFRLLLSPLIAIYYLTKNLFIMFNFIYFLIPLILIALGGFFSISFETIIFSYIVAVISIPFSILLFYSITIFKINKLMEIKAMRRKKFEDIRKKIRNLREKFVNMVKEFDQIKTQYEELDDSIKESIKESIASFEKKYGDSEILGKKIKGKTFRELNEFVETMEREVEEINQYFKPYLAD